MIDCKAGTQPPPSRSVQGVSLQQESPLRDASFSPAKNLEHVRVPNDYFEARADFLAAAESVQAEVRRYPIKARGPGGEELTVDFARIGPAGAKNVVVSISGVHGVEGYIGSAIQREFLRYPAKLPPDTAVILCHGLNAWGFAHNRRTSENNVDFNRNLPTGPEGYRARNEGYEQLANVLSPNVETFKPGILRFYGRVLPKIVFGYGRAKQALMKGQYTHPEGLYYGGKAQEEGVAIFVQHMKEELQNAAKVFGSDIHSGLGKHGQSLLLLAKGSDPAPLAPLEKLVPQCPVARGLDKSVVGVEVSGSIGAAMPKLFPDKKLFWFAQEAGTYGELKMLRALQEENVAWKSGLTDPKDPTRATLVEAFCPQDTEWRRKVIGDGLEIIDALVKLVA